jgi:hypothetical protein
MFRNLARMVADRFTEYRAQAEYCQRTADLFPEDRMGQEFAELAQLWRSIAEQSGGTSELAA